MLSRALTRLIVGAAFTYSAAAYGSPETATVRINTQGHLGPIRALDVDARGETLVTSGDDKTARVWDANTGALQRVLRIPIGAGNEGVANAVAITADGRAVAVGGWSATNDVCVFDRHTGEMTHRISGLHNVVTRLAFSPDGTQLAIGQFGDHAVVIASSRDDWRRVQLRTLDDDGRGTAQGLSWSPTQRGELVIARASGAIARALVSENEAKVLTRLTLPGGAAAFRATHSRDGRRVAIGSTTAPQTWIVDAQTLALQSTLASAAGTAGAASLVAWAGRDDGVIAAGTLRLNNQAVFARGAASGTTLALSGTALSSDSLLDLARVADEQWIAGNANGEWIRFDASGRVLARSGTDALDMRPLGGVWRTDAQAQAFALAGAAQMFTLDEGWLSTKTGAQNALKVPTPQIGASRLTDYTDRRDPKWNGRNIALDDNERALTGAVHPNGLGALLGTQWALRRIDAAGKVVWTIPTTSAVWQTAWSSDGKWALIATGDGSVRWLRARDGALQLSAFFHADGKRWVAWTPSGYFATSPGGEDLIGWHVNRGPDRAADYYPGSRLRATYYRPDVVARILSADDEAHALRLASESRGPNVPTAQPALPPVVRLILEGGGFARAGETISAKVNIRTPRSAPLSAVRARQDGELIELPSLRGLPPPRERGGELEYEIALSIPTRAQARQVSVFAENAAGASQAASIAIQPASPLATANVASKPAAVSSPASSATGDLRPVLYVLAVGVADYKDKELKLDFSAKDATDFANALKRQEGELYRQVHVKLLTDQTATRDGVLDGLDWIRRSMTARDIGMVFLAGHGVNDADDVYYYLPQDAQVNALKRTGVIFTEIKNTLASLPGKAMFFVDTCHSGNVLGSQRKTRSVAQRDITRVVNELASAENGVIVFAASTGKQLAQESPDWKNGAFTLALVEGLGGNADFAKSGRVTHKMLDLYVSERVKGLTEGAQSPVTIVPQGVPDFPLAVSRGPRS
jgi:hypothetical protein